MKRAATDSDVRAFIEEVCPEGPDLYMSSFDEATCLRDATSLIRQLRKRCAAEARVNERAVEWWRNSPRGKIGITDQEMALGEAVAALLALRAEQAEGCSMLSVESPPEGAKGEN